MTDFGWPDCCCFRDINVLKFLVRSSSEFPRCYHCLDVDVNHIHMPENGCYCNSNESRLQQYFQKFIFQTDDCYLDNSVLPTFFVYRLNKNSNFIPVLMSQHPCWILFMSCAWMTASTFQCSIERLKPEKRRLLAADWIYGILCEYNIDSNCSFSEGYWKLNKQRII